MKQETITYRNFSKSKKTRNIKILRVNEVTAHETGRKYEDRFLIGVDLFRCLSSDMSLRQFYKLACKPVFANQHRTFSITSTCFNSVGYGDLWDDAHNCPDHGHIKDDSDKSQAGESINMDSGRYAKHVADDYETSMDDVDEVLRRHDAKVSEGFLGPTLVFALLSELSSLSFQKHSMKSNKSAQHETDTGNSRPATGYN